VVQRDHSYFRYISGNFSELIKTESAKDEICRNLISYCRDGWPEKSKLHEKLRPYWTMQGEFTVHDNLLFKTVTYFQPALSTAYLLC
jgi:tRNA nucleotidyltransferase/poly(A) polymerase